MSRVVVTGGGGFLGGYVCRAFEARGVEAVPVGREDYDLTEQAEVRRLFVEQRPSRVVHLAAACGGIGANVANPGRFLYANALMGLMLLEEARRSGVSKLVVISTTCAYPQDAPLPLQEDTFWDGAPAGATRPYGLAKRLLHEACARYAQQYGFDAVVLVPANLYGPEDHFDPEHSHVIPALIRRLVEAEEAGAPEVVNWGTGRATREFLHVRDAARAIVLATERHADPAPVNLGTGQETSIAQVTRLIAEAVGYAGSIRWDPSKPDGQPRRFLDVSRAREAFGFAAEVPLAEGLSETVAWYRAWRER